MKQKKIKAAASDYTADLLPQTRKDQFFHILKNRNFALLKCGFILAACLLLIIIVESIFTRAGIAFYNEYVDGTITAEDYSRYHFYNVFISSIIEALLMPLVAVGISGTNAIIFKLIKDEPVFFRDDFKEGIKTNYKVQVVAIVIFGFLMAISRILIAFFASATGTGFEFVWIPIIAGLILIIIPLVLIILMFSSNYCGGFFNCLRNSFKIYLSGFWQNFIFSIVIAGLVFLPSLIMDVLLPAFIYLLLIILVIPIYILALSEFSLHIFDKYINSKYYPEHYREGLYNQKVKK